MKIKIVLLVVCFLAFGSINFAQSKKKPAAAANSPEQVVKNLYAAKGAANPFFQKKSRALVDKYFTGELADLIWKDATSAGDGVGVLDFNPFFYAQDDDITNLVIEKADENGVVKVKFKNFGKDDQILYTLVKENAQSKVWKIETVMYSDAEDLGSILGYGMMTEAEMKSADSANKMDGDYLVGTVKCNLLTNKSGYWTRVKCDDQENFQVIDTESLTFGTFNPDEKGRKGQFFLAADGTISRFVDASGKELKVSRAQSSGCGLNLEITESNISGLPIQNAAATAVNSVTKEVVKATLFEAMPVFGNLSAGKYTITVTKTGYKNTVKEISLDCRNLEADDQSVTENIFLQKTGRK